MQPVTYRNAMSDLIWDLSQIVMDDDWEDQLEYHATDWADQNLPDTAIAWTWVDNLADLDFVREACAEDPTIDADDQMLEFVWTYLYDAAIDYLESMKE